MEAPVLPSLLVSSIQHSTEAPSHYNTPSTPSVSIRKLGNARIYTHNSSFTGLKNKTLCKGWLESLMMRSLAASTRAKKSAMWYLTVVKHLTLLTALAYSWSQLSNSLRIFYKNIHILPIPLQKFKTNDKGNTQILMLLSLKLIFPEKWKVRHLQSQKDPFQVLYLLTYRRVSSKNWVILQTHRRSEKPNKQNVNSDGKEENEKINNVNGNLKLLI